jgi:hypothetical protein
MIGFDLKKYNKTGIFVETGTEHGNGIKRALKAGYTEIYSIEIAQNLYLGNVKRFWGDKRINLYCANSTDILGFILRNISKSVTIWLDAHVDNGYTLTDDKCPLIREIELIGESLIDNKVRGHTILIDDRRLFGIKNDWGHKINEGEVIDRLLMLDSRYDIHYEDGIQKDDIIVAEVKE